MNPREIKNNNLIGYVQHTRNGVETRTRENRIAYKSPGIFATSAMVDVSNKDIVDYAKYTASYKRMDGLFVKPKEQDGVGPIESLLIHAYANVKGYVKTHPTFTETIALIDGTDWEHAVESDSYHPAVSSIIITKIRDSYEVVVVIDRMRMLKRATHCIVRDRFSQPSIYTFTYSSTDTAKTAIDMINDAMMIFEQSKTKSYESVTSVTSLTAKALYSIYRKDREYPVAAAFLMDGVIWHVPRPGRHHHILHSYEFGVAQDAAVNKKYLHGFLTNHGNFISRKRAMFMAVNNRLVTGVAQMPYTYISGLTNSDDPALIYTGIINSKYDKEGANACVCDIPLFSEDIW